MQLFEGRTYRRDKACRLQQGSLRRRGQNGDQDMLERRTSATHSWDRRYKRSCTTITNDNALHTLTYLLRRISEDVAIEVLLQVRSWAARPQRNSLTAFPSSLKNSPPIHHKWFPFGHGVSVAFARRLGGHSTSSSVTLCASSHSFRIY